MRAVLKNWKGFHIMSDKSILLSISMLISGKKDMEKSLASLHYFTEAFPCEIILVDTGCKEEQRALAEKYADKVIDFPWCDDFAAARNAGLKEARGEWFMYLDDDEWFDNPQEIIAFFTSGEYKEYNCASYVVRNYEDFQGVMYEDSYPSRMVKLDPETKFVGAIHEYIEPYKLPKKAFSDFVHHYGYAYKDNEERKKHAQRNIGPLLKMRKKHPGDPRWMAQLAQEYFGNWEYQETLKVCKEGLEEWNAMKDWVEYAPSHVGSLYAFILVSLESIATPESYAEEKEWLEKAFADPVCHYNFMQPTVAFYRMAGARLYYSLKDHQKSRDYFRQYIDDTKRLRDDRDLIEVGAAAMVDGIFQESLLYSAILRCVESTIRVEDYALTEEAFYMIDWQDKKMLRQDKWELGMVDACCSVPYHPLWVKIMQTLVSRVDGTGMQEMLNVFLQKEIDYKKGSEEEKISRLRHITAQLDYENSYVQCAKIMWAEEDPDIVSAEERRETVERLFGELFEKYREGILHVRKETWDVALRQGISIEPLFMQIDYRRWRQNLEDWSHTADLEDFQKWDTLLATWRKQSNVRYDVFAAKHPAVYSLRYDLFAVKCLEGYLRHYQEVCPGLQQLEQMLWRYADTVLALYGSYYQEFVFEEMPEVLPEDARLALLLKELQGYREQGDDLKALECMRKCLGMYLAVENAVDAYAKMLRDEVQNRDRELSEAQVELRHLVATLKRTARLQLEKGETQAAREILLQVQQCAPEDEEVKELLEQT